MQEKTYSLTKHWRASALKKRSRCSSTGASGAALNALSSKARRALVRAASALSPLWVAIGLLLPAAVGALLAGGWAGALRGLLWGGLVRIFLVHHVTWSVNSVCHLWGSRPYRSDDCSRNNLVFGVLALGEGCLRALSAEEISALESQGSNCEDWTRVRVADGFAERVMEPAQRLRKDADGGAAVQVVIEHSGANRERRNQREDADD